MSRDERRVLAVYPTAYGYAFAYFDKPVRLVDWALRRLYVPRDQRNADSMAEIAALLDRYQPDVVVLEDWTFPGTRRSVRIRRLYRSIAHAANTRAIDLGRYARSQVQEMYASVGACSRYEIAQATAREFPALAHRLPRRPRKRYESEASVLGLFQAAALALTCYRNRPKEADLDLQEGVSA
jgi:hypothetical protein